MLSQINSKIIMVIFFLMHSHIISAIGQESSDSSLVLTFAGLMNTRADLNNQNEEPTSINSGIGALAEFNFYKHFGLESGVFVLNKQYETQAAGSRLVEDSVRLKIPVMARFWPVNFFAVGAGPYAAFQVGNSTTTMSIGDIQVASIKTSADEIFEFGFDFAVTLNFAVAQKTGLLRAVIL